MALDMEIRSSGVGSSEVAAICGLNPWQSAFDCYLEKTGQIEPFAGNERTEWGKILEPEILKRYEARTGYQVFPNSGTFAHKDRAWQLATPDALARQDGESTEKWIVEAKDVGFRMAGGWGDEQTDQIPPYYLTQVTWQLSALDLKQADVAALIDRKLHIYTVPLDKELEEILLEKVDRFWHDHVVAGVPPEITASDRTREWVRKKFASHTDLLRQASEEEALMMEALKRARVQREGYESVEESLKLRIQVAIGHDEGIAGDGFKATWRMDKGKKEYTVKAQPPKRVFRPTWEDK